MSKHRYYAVVYSVSLAGHVVACSGNGGAVNNPDAGVVGDVDLAGLTYNKDIAPIVNAKCVSCHSEGSIAPFGLETYAQVSAKHEHDGTEHDIPILMKQATASRAMPPWPPDNTGNCHAFQDARTLTELEIAMIGAWVDHGWPQGDPPEPEAIVPPASLDRVDAIIDMGADYTPASSSEQPHDDYRCFVVSADNDVASYLVAFEVKPGVKAIVHHIGLFTLDSPAAVAAANALDHPASNDDGRLGYQCFGGIGQSVTPFRFIGGWAPGITVTKYPEGTGIALAANQKFVLQVHYNLENGAQADRTALDLKLEAVAGSDIKAAQILAVADVNFSIPPGLPPTDPEAKTQGNLTLNKNSTVWGLGPHMHTMGATIGIDALQDGDSSCLITIPDWDFHWQQPYFYAPGEEVTLQSGAKLTVTCTYDTRGRDPADGNVTHGEGTKDEMCGSTVYVTQ